MTSQLVLCKISLNDYNSATKGDIKKRLLGDLTTVIQTKENAI